MLDLIRATLHRIYSLYRDVPKKLFELSIYVALASVGLGLTSGLVLAWLVWKLDLLPLQYMAEEFGDFVLTGMFWDGVQRVTSFVLLGYGLFAVRMRDIGERTIAQHSFASIWRSITAKNWSTFIIAWLALFVLNLVFYRSPFDSSGNELGYVPLSWTDDGLGTTVAARYAAWANELLKLLLGYLPYLVVLCMLLADRGIPIIRKTLRSRTRVIGAMLIIGFAVNALINESYYYLTSFIFPPLTIPFEDSALASVFRFMVTLVLTAWTLPGVVLCLWGPLDEHDRITSESSYEEHAHKL
jgi:hypothetical protein